MPHKDFTPEQRKVILVPHDPNWANQAALEAKRIREGLSIQVLAVHHIGSTAIPSIKAKPILDFVLVVQSLHELDKNDAEMEALGYEPKGERGIPGRRFFSKDTHGKRSHHVHAFQQNNSEIERHIIFRDYLLNHPEDAAAYERLKVKLAKKFPNRSGDYTEGKSDFIYQIVEKAQRWKRQQKS